MHNNAKFVVAGLLIAAAVAYLVISNIGSTAHYFLIVEELQVMGGGAVGRNVTISGVVLGGSLVLLIVRRSALAALHAAAGTESPRPGLP